MEWQWPGHPPPERTTSLGQPLHHSDSHVKSRHSGIARRQRTGNLQWRDAIGIAAIRLSD